MARTKSPDTEKAAADPARRDLIIEQFGLAPADVLAFCDYGDRLVVVTVDGRKLEMAAEAGQ